MAFDFYSEIKRNKRMTFVLFFFFFLLVGILAYVVSFVFDLFYGFGFAYIFTLFGIFTIIFSLISYYKSDKIVLKVTGAKKAEKEIFKQYHNIVEELCIASGLPKPGLYYVNESAINAFATGRNPKNAVISVTSGALNNLNREQLQGVIAHELSHIQNYDVRTMTLASVLVGFTVLISDLLLRMFIFGSFRGNNSRDSGGFVIIMIALAVFFAILTPIVAKMINFAISRKAEFSADASAVRMTRNPLGLASALEQISKDSEVLKTANKATSHLYISNPLKGQKLFLKKLFATHPPIDERIRILKAQKL